nr:reverse transcriptase [Solanum melongena]WMB96869.1 reverse transcriptase [Solanum melongena]WMB97044.1 reverse transcriptase [Solanum aethiopicum]
MTGFDGVSLGRYCSVMWLPSLRIFLDSPLLQLPSVFIDGGGPCISHLFFADDLMLFAEASHDQMELIKHCIGDFSEASGLMISPAKSKLFVSPNVCHQVASSLSNLVGFPLTRNLGRSWAISWSSYHS